MSRAGCAVVSDSTAVADPETDGLSEYEAENRAPREELVSVLPLLRFNLEARIRTHTPQLPEIAQMQVLTVSTDDRGIGPGEESLSRPL